MFTGQYLNFSYHSLYISISLYIIRKTLFCVLTTSFYQESDIYQQVEDLAVCSLLLPVMLDTYIEYFDEMALRMALQANLRQTITSLATIHTV